MDRRGSAGQDCREKSGDQSVCQGHSGTRPPLHRRPGGDPNTNGSRGLQTFMAGQSQTSSQSRNASALAEDRHAGTAEGRGASARVVILEKATSSQVQKKDISEVQSARCGGVQASESSSMRSCEFWPGECITALQHFAKLSGKKLNYDQQGSFASGCHCEECKARLSEWRRWQLPAPAPYSSASTRSSAGSTDVALSHGISVAKAVTREKAHRRPVSDSGTEVSDSDNAYSSASSSTVTRWSTEEYMVLPGMYRHVLCHLGITEEPSVDAFAKKSEHVVSRYWGPGGVKSDAWAQDWGAERLIWCNAPFSAMDQVVRKMISDQARMVIIAPD